MKFLLRVLPVIVLAAVIAVAIPLTADRHSASASGEAMLLAISAEGFVVTDILGSPVTVVSEEKNEGQVTTELATENGAKGVLLQLNWLTTPEPAANITQPKHMEEQKYLDEAGNLVSSGWVTSEQTKIPDNVVTKPLFGVLSEVNTIQLGWHFSSQKNTNIYRDGKLIATTKHNIFVDTNLEAATSYNYRIVAVGEEANTAKNQKDKFFDETTFVDNPNDFSLTITAKTLENTVGDFNSAAGKKINYSTPYYELNSLMHVTYIEEDILETTFAQKIGCNGADAFLGDGRQDVTPSYSYFPVHRTAIRVMVNWNVSDPWNIFWQKSVGPTAKITYNSPPEFSYASDAGIQVLNAWTTDDVVHFEILHDVGNPFCQFGSIKYGETVQFWKVGAVAVNGHHNEAPRHEAYAIYNNSDGIVKLWNFEEPNFDCLFGWFFWCDNSYMASENSEI